MIAVSFYSESELKMLGLMSIGDNVKISRKVSFYNADRISIGDNTRIDDYCVLSAGDGGIFIGKNVHIAVFCSLIGKGSIYIHDYVGLSSRVSIYSSNDDYSGQFMTNPTVDKEYTNVTVGEIIISKHVIIGSGSIVLPNVRIDEGVAIGALSLVNQNCAAFTMYSGNPIRRLLKRSKKLLELEYEYELNQKQMKERL